MTKDRPKKENKVCFKKLYILKIKHKNTELRPTYQYVSLTSPEPEKMFKVKGWAKTQEHNR